MAKGLELNKKLLADAAKTLGYEYSLSNFDRLDIQYKDKQVRFLGVVPDALRAYDKRVADDKLLSRVLMRKCGVKPIVKDYVLTNESVEKAVKTLSKSSCSHFVVKPRFGSRGIGVTLDVDKTLEAVLAVMKKLHAQHLFPLMLEEQVEGRDFRFFVVGKSNPEIVAVLERVPAHVVGDGKTSLKDLIARANQDRLANLYTKDKPIIVESKLNTKKIIPQNEKVFLAKTANMSTGGTSVQVSIDSIAPEILTNVVKAHQCSNLPYSGIDVLAKDLSDPSTAYVNEINAIPDFAMHHYPNVGKAINVAERILASLIEDQG